MVLTGIDCQIPSSRIYNEEIIELVKFYSATKYVGSIQNLDSLLRRYLKLTGINSRFWRSEKEKPIELIKIATERALKMANLKKNEVDLVIYSSIDRGFIEPANASFICKAIGIKDTRSFDIVDACMGWGTAVQTANSFLTSNSGVNSVMIVNAEFPMDKNGSVLPNNFTIQHNEELHWKAASFTLGEAASVSIFQKSDTKALRFEFIESPEFSELCTIPLANFEKYISDYSGKGIASTIQFHAFGAELLERGMGSAVTVLQALLEKIEYTPALIFPHSVSNKVIQDATLNAKINCPVYSTVSELGNIATVSVPSAIVKALLNNLIQKGDKCVAWIASAGMKFSAFEVKL